MAAPRKADTVNKATASRNMDMASNRATANSLDMANSQDMASSRATAILSRYVRNLLCEGARFRDTRFDRHALHSRNEERKRSCK